jgi:hypothetical protein
MSASSLILPYTVPEKSRKKKFNESMEFTAILCLAEARRKKHVLVGSSPKKVSFISKLHYPFWAVPWENRYLITDGLQVQSATITYRVLPDLELFLNDVQRGQIIREQFQNALNKHVGTFAEFSETVNVPIESLIADKVLLSDVSEYVEETLALKADVTGNITLIPPRLDENRVSEGAQKIVDLYERIQSDIKGLEHSSRVLNETMQFHEQKILQEIQLAKETFNEEVNRVKPDVEKKVELLLRERDAKIEKMNKVAEAELNVKLRERERRQRELEKLEINRSGYKRKLDARKRGHDEIGVTRWEHSLRTCENKIAEVKERIHDLSRFIEKTRQQNQEDANKLRYSYQTSIDRERKKLSSIEASLESVIKTKESEIERLRMMTTGVASHIERLAEQKRLHTGELKNLAIPLQLEQVTLLCVPFYLVGYKDEDKLVFHAYSPFRVMSSEGIVKKIKKTLLSFRLTSRIKLLLQSRSKGLNKMLSAVLEEKTKTDKTLQESVQKLGELNNLFMNSNLKEMLTEGLKQLEAEGWIKQEESITLMKLYT